MLEAARLHGGPLDDLAGAVERYERVLELQPGQDGAVGDLVELCKKEDVSEQAATLVRPHLVSHARWQDLAVLLDARARLSQDPDEIIASLRELATVRHEKLGEKAEAEERFRGIEDFRFGDAHRFAAALPDRRQDG
jgi:hypothetical protein